MQWIRRLLLVVAGLAGGALAVVVVGRWYFHDLLNGPALAPTSLAISLKEEFPPPAGWSEAAVAPVLAYADSLASSAVIALADAAPRD